MSYKSNQNEGIIQDLLETARERDEKWRAERNYRASFGTAESKPFGLSAGQLARDSDLTQGQVAGALKRLQAAGTVEKVKTTRGNRSAEYAAHSEVLRAKAVARTERIEELIEDHGSADAYGEKILKRINTARAILDELESRVNIRGSEESNVLALARISNAIPERRYSGRNVDEIREILGDPLRKF